MWNLFSEIMSSVSSSDPIVYLCYFLMVMATYGAFMRFLYTIFKPW